MALLDLMTAIQRAWVKVTPELQDATMATGIESPEEREARRLNQILADNIAAPVKLYTEGQISAAEFAILVENEMHKTVRV
jgi:hypothetical protein